MGLALGLPWVWLKDTDPLTWLRDKADILFEGKAITELKLAELKQELRAQMRKAGARPEQIEEAVQELQGYAAHANAEAGKESITVSGVVKWTALAAGAALVGAIVLRALK